MRIAIVSPPWVAVPPPAYGGTENVIDTLARGLQAAGHDVLLFATGDSTCPVPTEWVYPQALGTAGASTAAEIRHVVHAYEKIRSWGADVVHDHTLAGPIWAHRLGIRVVTTNHGPFRSDLGDVYRAMSRATPVVAISHHQASTAEGTEVAQVIHHGVDLEQFPAGPGDGGFALFLGRMNPDKGVHTAIDLARAAGVPLKIAAKMAEPAERRYFVEEVKPRLGGDVVYLGEVDHATKVELLGQARCLLNPIAWPEPFGMVMIESLACGTPVLATRRGSVPEIVEDGRTGFVREDARELVAALGRLDELDRAECRAAVKERFSQERMVRDHLELYRRVLDGHRLTRAA